MAKGLRSNQKRVVRSLRRIAVAQNAAVVEAEQKRAAAMAAIVAEATVRKAELQEASAAMQEDDGQAEAQRRGRQGGPSDATEDPSGPAKMEVERSNPTPLKKKAIKLSGKQNRKFLGPGLNNFHPRYKKGTKKKFKSIFNRHD